MADKVSRRPKKTNYQRLWRGAKQDNVALQNYANGMLIFVRKILSGNDLKKFEAGVEYLRKQTIEKAHV